MSCLASDIESSTAYQWIEEDGSCQQHRGIDCGDVFRHVVEVLNDIAGKMEERLPDCTPEDVAIEDWISIQGS
jgi:hypothetical protein